MDDGFVVGVDGEGVIIHNMVNKQRPFIKANIAEIVQPRQSSLDLRPVHFSELDGACLAGVGGVFEV